MGHLMSSSFIDERNCLDALCIWHFQPLACSRNDEKTAGAFGYNGPRNNFTRRLLDKGLVYNCHHMRHLLLISEGLLDGFLGLLHHPSFSCCLCLFVNHKSLILNMTPVVHTICCAISTKQGQTQPRRAIRHNSIHVHADCLQSLEEHPVTCVEGLSGLPATFPITAAGGSNV